VDPDGLLEYSVVFTDRSLNHMSQTFQGVMTDISTTMKTAYGADAVVVSYTDDSEIQNGKKFAGAGVQIAAGVPLRCDEPQPFSTFRLGLFGLDKLHNIDRSVAALERALSQIL
jgi:hypothetical protein